MSKFQTIKGIMKTFFHITKEDWNEMDHKLIRLAAGAAGFIIMALVWFYFLRSISPWPML